MFKKSAFSEFFIHRGVSLRGLSHIYVLRSWPLLLVSTCLGLTLLPKQAKSQDALLLGGQAPAPKPRPLDRKIPRGPLRNLAFRPLQELSNESQLLSQKKQATATIQRCSFLAPICALTRASAARSEVEVSLALELLEKAYERAVLGAGMIGLSASLEPQLLWDISDLAPLKTQGYAALNPGFDRGKLICFSGEVTAENAHLCVVEGLLQKLSPATQAELRHGFALYSSEAMTSHTQSLRQSAELAQKFIEAGILDGSPKKKARTPHHPEPIIGVGSGTAALLAEFMGRKLGRRSAFEAIYLAHIMAISKSTGQTYIAEPDLFDLYRHSISEQARDVARLYGSFSTERTFDNHLRSASKPRWQLQASELPHNLLFSRGLGTYGASYLDLDVSTLAANAAVGVRLYCEGPISYQFTLLRLNKEKSELSRFVFPFRQGTHTFSQRIESSPSTHYFRLVLTALGGIGSAYPFDPDQGPFRRRHCGVYLTREKSEETTL